MAKELALKIVITVNYIPLTLNYYFTVNWSQYPHLGVCGYQGLTLCIDLYHFIEGLEHQRILSSMGLPWILKKGQLKFWGCQKLYVDF